MIEKRVQVVLVPEKDVDVDVGIPEIKTISGTYRYTEEGPQHDDWGHLHADDGTVYMVRVIGPNRRSLYRMLKDDGAYEGPLYIVGGIFLPPLTPISKPYASS